jgi:hypothetical protein
MLQMASIYQTGGIIQVPQEVAALTLLRSFLSPVLCCLLGSNYPNGLLRAQAPQPGPAPAKLNLIIVEGEGAVNNVRQRVTREPIVQVEDENNRPVAGAAVVFTLPGTGASGTFADGSRVLTVLTDQNGRAAMRGFTPNNVAGKMEIRVTASYRGQTASATISQTNVAAAAAAGAGSGKLIAILAVVGGAAIGGVVAATRGGGSSPAPPVSPPPPQPTVITPGTPTVGPPR